MPGIRGYLLSVFSDTPCDEGLIPNSRPRDRNCSGDPPMALPGRLETSVADGLPWLRGPLRRLAHRARGGDDGALETLVEHHVRSGVAVVCIPGRRPIRR